MRFHPPVFITLFIAAFAIGNSIVMAQSGTDDRWKEVQEAQSKGLPKTAIGLLEEIQKAAEQRGAVAEAIRAQCQRYLVDAGIQGGDTAAAIRKLQVDLPNASAPAQPVLKALLANWYWGYYQQNRWRFLERSRTQVAPGDDFATWDLPRILAEADSLFTAALAEPEPLKKVQVAEYSALLEKGSVPDTYRPTLYDFLAFEAIEFYTLAEQGNLPEGAFELRADGAILADWDEFLKWEIPQSDVSSAILKALRLLQELARFHATDSDPAARLDLDLTRLAFGSEHAAGDEKGARFKAALRRFMDRNRAHEAYSRAAAILAGTWSSEGDFVQARKVALEGSAVHRDSTGWSLCQNMLQAIEAPAGQVSTERVWNQPWPTIDVQYKNVSKVYFRLVEIDVDGLLRTGKYVPGQVPWESKDALRTHKPVRAWSADLPPTPDYRQRTERVKLPDDLPLGPHYLISSFNPTFTEDNNQISMAEVWITRLALVLRPQYGDGQLSGMVVDSQTGNPVQGAEAIVWVPQAQRNSPIYRPLPAVKTDENGLFQIAAQENVQQFVQIRDGAHQLFADQQVWQQSIDLGPKPFQRTFLFTDRSIYRPGQTISYKGVCLNAEPSSNQYTTVPKTSVTIVLRDVNGEDVESHTHTTNERGSFSGTFTGPRDRGTGIFTLSMTAGPGGQQGVQIEEYKRPKFFVTLDKPVTAPRLLDEVVVSGKASAYSTAPVDNASVRYRVVRQVRYPDWWFYRCWWWPRDREPQEIAHGTTTTDANGAFKISFKALPDAKVPQESEPVFTFAVTADVVDTTGETRSGNQDVRVGYTALEATVSADAWQTPAKPVVFRVATKSLDGQGQEASGTVKVFRLQQPDRVKRGELAGQNIWRMEYLRSTNPTGDATEPDWSNDATWPDGDLVLDKPFGSNGEGAAQIDATLPAGVYRVRVLSQDRFGKEVHAEQIVRVLDPDSKTFPIKMANILQAESWTVEPGDELLAVWGTGYDAGRAFVEVEHRGKILRQYWTDARTTQHALRVPIDESMRGGFTVRVTFVHENRAYLQVQHVDVPWSNKKLAIRWEHFVSKLQPGSQETWTAVVTGSDPKLAAAEMVAALYDASLDAFLPHMWPTGFDLFHQDQSSRQLQFQNHDLQLQVMYFGWQPSPRTIAWEYRHFPYEIGLGGNFYRGALFGSDLGSLGMPGAGRQEGFGGPGYGLGRNRSLQLMDSMAAEPMAMAADGMAQEGRGSDKAMFAGPPMPKSGSREYGQVAGGQETGMPTPGTGVNLEAISARTNLQETAFFFPHLLVEEDGSVRMQFKMPEALTEWKFLGFAHDTEARAGLLTEKVVSSKDLMVQPNPPRFLREGDILEFTVKVANKSATQQSGKVQLAFSDAATRKPYDVELENGDNVRSFEIAAGESRSFSWRLHVPDDARMLVYKAVAGTDRVSDGEEGYLPILSRRVLVTEALPLPVRGKQSREFSFDRLRNAGDSKSLKHQGLTVQVTSNPAWYAVLALPYLMEFPYECNEQTFNRLYANALASHIANSQPRIRQVFEQWRGTKALESPLLKNEDLKAVMLEETPWLREAKQESETRRNVGLLFESNRIEAELKQAQQKLTQAQFEDGTWSWFPGGRSNEYITLYIVTGYGRLRHLGVKTDVAPALRAVPGLDNWMSRLYEGIKQRGQLDQNQLSSTICLYLYGRSFFSDDLPIAPENQVAFRYFQDQGKKYWNKLGDRQSQGHLAIALKRFGNAETPNDIIASLRERSLTEDEMGMFWREGESSWWWYQAPIETQALMIEVFDEVAADTKAVEELKIWLIKQKQTQDWKTTKATADAVYGLLLRGDEMLSTTDLVEITLGDVKIQPESVEVGTGYYQKRLSPNEITPSTGIIKVHNPNPGVAWGSVHWQYFEDMQNVTAYAGTPLKLSKQLFTKQDTPQGPTLVPVTDKVVVGDELVTRLELRVDRAMEFVHLKDYRGSGTEPVDVLSQYRYQDGLAYYQSTRDTATHFFIDYLPRGTYVFEYSSRVQHKGEYQTGYALIECMYAPEFNSHSESLGLKVQ